MFGSCFGLQKKVGIMVFSRHINKQTNSWNYAHNVNVSQKWQIVLDDIRITCHILRVKNVSKNVLQIK